MVTLTANSAVIQPRAGAVVQFEDFYRSQVDRVYRALALALNNQDLAREATDEAMARAYLHWRKIRDHDNPGGWAYRVGLNWATSYWRRFRRERPGAASVHGFTTDVSNHPANEMLASLPVQQRAVVVCRIMFDLSISETASVLGLTEGTVKSRLSRALTSLRGSLQEQTR